MQDIDSELSALSLPPFDLSLAGAGHFAEGDRIRAIWAGVEPSEPLKRLAARCETAARRALPVTQLTDDGVRYARQGKILSAEQARPSAPGAVSAWFAPDGRIVALGVSNEAGHKVVRGFR